MTDDELEKLRREVAVLKKRLDWLSSVNEEDEAESLRYVFPVTLTQTGGSAGTSSSQCSFTYTVKDRTGSQTLGTAVAMTGNGQRIVNAAMTAGTYGMAYWYTDGTTLKLIWADERVTQTNCT